MALKAEIQDLIEDYNSDPTEAPRFSTEELITIAGVCNDAEWLQDKQTHRAVLATFPYYANRALDAYVNNAVHPYNDTEKEALNSELPLIMEEQAEDLHARLCGNCAMHSDLTGSWLYSADHKASRIYLRRWLESERKGTFDFQGLPPELRTKIYELVLEAPASGLAKYHHYRDHGERFFVRDRDCATILLRTDGKISDVGGYFRYMPRNPHRYLFPSIGDRLRLLETCKQVFTEAVAVFYQQNYFIFAHPRPLVHNFFGLANTRVKHMSKLQFTPEADPDNTLGTVARLLTSITEIKRLELNLETDYYWLKMRNHSREWITSDRKRPFASYDQIPSFPEIAVAAARAQEFVVVGDCPKGRAYFEAGVAKVKKRVEVEEVDEEMEPKPQAVRAKTAKGSAKTAQNTSTSAQRTKKQKKGGSGV
ncbi:hypothetical protein LTR78_005292 [Recurvomyces mirabilis]|uniref:DUF7730 domain-containing protein n=1 Tax=Recurvomyces mirabilis TaxID=574656 RepID=A0AAE0WNG7_9PEZI|nr:hypothetical protein LTR78_005292 [Recurvomyces mirabilis]KAK5157842.1 hypothetical protein LTS14_003764 [Recurvomyces mirabilis]